MIHRPAIIALCLVLKILGEVFSTVHIVGYGLYAACDAALLALARRLDR